jgi:hypothetical protein
MRLVDRLRGNTAERSDLSMDWWLAKLAQAGTFQPGVGRTLEGTPKIDTSGDFSSLVSIVHEQCSPVSAAVQARALLLSQLRFKFRSLVDGRLFGTPALEALERPGSCDRPTLLSLIEMHDSYAGNAFVYRNMGMSHVLRPDWTSVVLTSDSTDDPLILQSEWPADTRAAGYVYSPGGPGRGDPFFLPAGSVAHWMPEPDPLFPWRGRSWVQSVLSEALLDIQATGHQSKFFENAATPQMVFSLDEKLTATQVKEFAEVINAGHAGSENAYKNLFLGGGADVTVVGSDLKALSLRDMQGGFETRVSVRSRVPAAILGVREGLAGSALNSGNYTATRRLWADGWFAPSADSLCSALESIVETPRDAELAHDPAQVLFLQEDRSDEAEIQGRQAATLRTLIEAGYEPDSAREAVITDDFSKLVHSKLYSVQLQSPGSKQQIDSQAAVEET